MKSAILAFVSFSIVFLACSDGGGGKARVAAQKATTNSGDMTDGDLGGPEAAVLSSAQGSGNAMPEEQLTPEQLARQKRYEDKKFEDVVPGVTDRFFIGPDNSIYYDFKRPDDRWDLEVKAEEFANIPDPNNQPKPNLILEGSLGFKQVHPARLLDKRLILFIVDKNDVIKIISQKKASSPEWESYSKAIELEKGKLIFPRINDEGLIELLYMYDARKMDEKSFILFSRVLTDEDKLLFSAPDPSKDFTQEEDQGILFEGMRDSLVHQGIAIVSLVPGDREVLEKLKKLEPLPEEEEAFGLSEVEVGNEDNRSYGKRFTDGYTQKGTYGESMTHWKSAHDICTNVTSTMAVAAIATTGPITAMMYFGMAGGLRRDENAPSYVQVERAPPCNPGQLCKYGGAGSELSGMVPENEFDYFKSLLDEDADDETVLIPFEEGEEEHPGDPQLLTEDELKLVDKECSDYLAKFPDIQSKGATAEEIEHASMCTEFGLILELRAHPPIPPEDDPNLILSEDQIEVFGEELKETQDARTAGGGIAIYWAKNVYDPWIQGGGKDFWKASEARTKTVDKLGRGFIFLAVSPFYVPLLAIFKSVNFIRDLRAKGGTFKYYQNYRASTLGEVVKGYDAKMSTLELVEKLPSGTKPTLEELKKLSSFEKLPVKEIEKLSNKDVKRLAANELSKLEELKKERGLVESKREKFQMRSDYARLSNLPTEIAKIEAEITKANLETDPEKQKKLLEPLTEKKSGLLAEQERITGKTRPIQQDIVDKQKQLKTEYKEKFKKDLPTNWREFAVARINKWWTGLKTSLINFAKSPVSKTWSGVKKGGRGLWSGLKAYGMHFVNNVKSARANPRAATGRQAGAGAMMVGCAMVSAYGKDENAGKAAKDVITESPQSMAGGMSAIHSTMGSLCSGNFGDAMKDVLHLGAGLANGLVDLSVSLLKLACNGLKQIDPGTKKNHGVNVRHVAKETVCGVYWLADKTKDVAHKAINGTEMVAGKVAGFVGDFLLVDPNDINQSQEVQQGGEEERLAP